MSLNTATLNSNFTVITPLQKYTNIFNGQITTSGSTVSSAQFNIPTGSWTTLPSGSNKDLVVAYIQSNASSSLVYVSVGATTNTASILWPIAKSTVCQLSYSGSTSVFVQAVGAEYPVLVGYTLISYN